MSDIKIEDLEKFIDVAEKLCPGFINKVNATIKENDKLKPLESRLYYIVKDIKHFEAEALNLKCVRADIDKKLLGVESALKSLEREQMDIRYKIVAETKKKNTCSGDLEK